MAKSINWTINVQIDGGPGFSATESAAVDAYDSFDIPVEVISKTQNKPKHIFVHPGVADGPVQFFLIKSNTYGDDLTYSIDTEEDDKNKRIKLNRLQAFMGAEVVKKLGTTIKDIYVYNELGSEVNIQILVGRVAAVIVP